jgi:alkanesulfonate monooxygenase SsuD/methylene tetrahydromethanopterin reductase-like flavin-dependent oxidoreductase (luciferase family)
VRVLAFHLMPYSEIDPSFYEKYGPAWVTLPNTLFDRKAGYRLYNRFLDELEYADSAGFDGICVNEHHQNGYGMMPQPGVFAGALARRTKGWLALLGRALPLVNNPLNIAEEFAEIDQLTGGRLIAGFVRGIGSEYHSSGVNPTESHDRFHEAHDLIVRAWTEPGPFRFEGKYYDYEYVNTWPRTFQDPHPQIWIPSQGSSETIRFAAAKNHRYTYLQTFSPITAVAKYMQMYKDVANEQGYEATPDQLGWSLPIYCAATDEQAREEARPHAEMFVNKYLKISPEMLLPPGYTTAASIKGMMQAKAGMLVDRTLEDLLDSGMFIVGSPKTVREKLIEAQRQIGFGNLLMTIQFGTLPHDLTMNNIKLLAEEVVPYIKEHAKMSTAMPAA